MSPLPPDHSTQYPPSAGDKRWTDGARLIDFHYPAADDPHGVIEEGTPSEIRQDIAANAAAIEASLTEQADLRFDCGHACHRWELLLRRLGHLVREEGGVGG